jgi:hypothetical protein
VSFSIAPRKAVWGMQQALIRFSLAQEYQQDVFSPNCF